MVKLINKFTNIIFQGTHNKQQLISQQGINNANPLNTRQKQIQPQYLNYNPQAGQSNLQGNFSKLSNQSFIFRYKL